MTVTHPAGELAQPPLPEGRQIWRTQLRANWFRFRENRLAVAGLALFLLVCRGS